MPCLPFRLAPTLIVNPNGSNRENARRAPPFISYPAISCHLDGARQSLSPSSDRPAATPTPRSCCEAAAKAGLCVTRMNESSCAWNMATRSWGSTPYWQGPHARRMPGTPDMTKFWLTDMVLSAGGGRVAVGAPRRATREILVLVSTFVWSRYDDLRTSKPQTRGHDACRDILTLDKAMAPRLIRISYCIAWLSFLSAFCSASPAVSGRWSMQRRFNCPRSAVLIRRARCFAQWLAGEMAASWSRLARPRQLGHDGYRHRGFMMMRHLSPPVRGGLFICLRYSVGWCW